MKITEVKKCRLCEGEIKDVILFGDVALANNYIKPEDIDLPELKAPLVVSKCNYCGHVQLKHSVDKETLFSNYLYSSSNSGSLVNYFRNYTDEVIAELGIKPEDGYILELGSNDGVALRHFLNKGFRVIGVDPASNLAEIANSNGIFTINKFFNKEVAEEILNEYGYPICIISNNTYAHLEEHKSFTEGVITLLNNKNSFVFENAYLLDTIRGLYFDQCLIPGQEIITSAGFKKIERVSIGDKVLTHTGQWERVTELFKNQNHDDIYEIQVYGQTKTLNVTANHPIFVCRNGENKFVLAKDLKKTDYILKPFLKSQSFLDKISIEHPVGNSHKSTQYNFKINEELCKIIGFYLAEGYYYECKPGCAQAEFSFGKGDFEKLLAEECGNALRKHGAKSVIKLTEFGWHVITYGGMARFLYQHFHTGASHKEIPGWIYDLNNNLLKCLLYAYVRGDGYIYRGGNYWRASTVSESLANGIALLSNKIGYSCSINIGKLPSPRFIHKNKKITYPKNPIQILIRLNERKKIKVYTKNGYQHYLIRDIVIKKYEGYVYNLHVEKDNSYTTIQGAVHNCYSDHLSYYGITPLYYFFVKLGLDIFRIKQTPNQGGSIRVFVKSKENSNYQIDNYNILALMNKEIEFGLYSNTTYHEFLEKLETVKQKLLNLISNYSSISCYGCPAKFALFSKFFGLSRENVKYVVDDSPFKQGLLAPESKIPIVDRNHFLNNPTDACIISAWNFSDLIKKNNPQYKGKWINPFDL